VNLREFYEAYFQLERAFHFGFNKLKSDVGQQLCIYKLIIQAVIFLMKRKFENAMPILQVIDHSKQEDKQLQYMILAYRAYGLISTSSYEDAIKDLNIAKKLEG
jgi:hypothetical protein